MKKLLTIFVTICLSLVLFGVVTLFTSAIPSHGRRADTKEITAKLNAITTCCSGGDIIFHLHNQDNSSYYINRGLENGLKLKELQEALLGKEVTVAYRNGGWNVLNYRNRARHICEVRLEGNVLYSEIRD